MKKYEWVTIDESLFLASGEKEYVQVSKTKDYWLDMCAQNKRVLAWLREKYPAQEFRVKDFSHEFGQYQEVQEYISYDVEVCEDCGDDVDWCVC